MAVVQTPQKGGRWASPSQKRRNLVNYSRGREIVAGALRPASLFPEEKSSIPERAVCDLADEIVLARGVVIGLALALDVEDVGHQGHLHVLRIHARQGELDDVGAVLRPPLRGGKPRRTLSGLIRGAAEESLG